MRRTATQRRRVVSRGFLFRPVGPPPTPQRAPEIRRRGQHGRRLARGFPGLSSHPCREGGHYRYRAMDFRSPQKRRCEVVQRAFDSGLTHYKPSSRAAIPPRRPTARTIRRRMSRRVSACLTALLPISVTAAMTTVSPCRSAACSSMSERNQFGLPREIPGDVRRAIRKRCGFGCVICGAALYEYHHFNPAYVDAVEHNPNNIALLCGSHHDKATKGMLSDVTVREASLHPVCHQRDSHSKHLI